MSNQQIQVVKTATVRVRRAADIRAEQEAAAAAAAEQEKEQAGE